MSFRGDICPPPAGKTVDFFPNLGETSYERIFLQIKEW